MLDRPHDPARGDDSTYEEDKTEAAEADHHLRLSALCDTEDNRSAQGEEQHGGEVSEHGLGSFPSVGQ
jgi:hypothetical protein